MNSSSSDIHFSTMLHISVYMFNYIRGRRKQLRCETKQQTLQNRIQPQLLARLMQNHTPLIHLSSMLNRRVAKYTIHGLQPKTWQPGRSCCKHLHLVAVDRMGGRRGNQGIGQQSDLVSKMLLICRNFYHKKNAIHHPASLRPDKRAACTVAG